jgi:hypothetical protein
MAIMQKVALKEKYVQIPNETAKAVEIKAPNPISLTALGLITNLWSYDVEKWELHKTELYKRFAKNKKTAVSNAWDELVETNYIIEFKYRVGSSWEYVYIYRIEPFSEEEKKELLAQCADIYGVKSTSDFQLLKMGSSKRGVQNQHISNEKEKQNNKKEIQNKEIQTIVNNNGLTKIDILDLINSFYTTMAPNRWSKKQWINLVDKLSDELVENENFQNVNNPLSYIEGCLKNICYKHDFKNGKIEIEETKYDSNLPFYNWLDA